MCVSEYLGVSYARLVSRWAGGTLTSGSRGGRGRGLTLAFLSNNAARPPGIFHIVALKGDGGKIFNDNNAFT